MGVKAFLALALTLHAADFGLTLIGLSRGFSEAGAVAAPALVGFGLWGLALIPVVGLLVQGLVIRYLLPRRFRRAGYAVVLLVASIPVVLNAALLA